MSSCMHTQTHADPLKPFNFSKKILLEKGEAQTKSSAAKKGMNVHSSTSHGL